MVAEGEGECGWGAADCVWGAVAGPTCEFSIWVNLQCNSTSCVLCNYSWESKLCCAFRYFICLLAAETQHILSRM
jgi:hypothetical protein